MWWRVRDDYHSLDCFFSPILEQAQFETTLHVLRLVSSSFSLDLTDKLLHLLNILVEGHEFEAALVPDIAVAHEGDAALQTSVLFALFDRLVNDVHDCLLGLGDPGGHGRGAVEEQTKFEGWFRLWVHACLSQVNGLALDLLDEISVIFVVTFVCSTIETGSTTWCHGSSSDWGPGWSCASYS